MVNIIDDSGTSAVIPARRRGQAGNTLSNLNPVPGLRAPDERHCGNAPVSTPPDDYLFDRFLWGFSLILRGENSRRHLRIMYG